MTLWGQTTRTFLWSWGSFFRVLQTEEETMRAEKRRVGLRETLVGIVITLFTFASAPADEEEDTTVILIDSLEILE